MSSKTLDDASLKAAVLQDQRTIEFYMLAFGSTPDKQGDMISATAADDWLDRFYAAGMPLPISFTHAAVKDSTNPFNIIGYAPADPEHVFKDSHGIRVVANVDVDTNPTAAQAYGLAKRGIVTGASVAYFTSQEGQTYNSDGSITITKIDDILEAGPCLDPANEDAYVLAVKAMELQTKAVDESPWDGGAAWRSCSSAADYRSICAGERSVGTPDERQHWALPHHQRPGAPPNAGGVRNALSRLPQTEGLTNAGAARSHLDAHMREINPERAASAPVDSLHIDLVLHELTGLSTKAGRFISAANRAKLRAAQEVIHELLSLDEQITLEPDAKAMTNGEEPEGENPEESGPDAELRRRLAVAIAGPQAQG